MEVEMIVEIVEPLRQFRRLLTNSQKSDTEFLLVLDVLRDIDDFTLHHDTENRRKP